MNFRKTIKKIMALGVGAAFIGATVMSATAAADLSTYPAPFVKDGQFNAIIVVGKNAKADDVLGSIDIATTLQYASKVTKTVNTGGGSSVTLAGDSKKLEESTNVLELGEALTSIRSSLTSSDLKALQDGSILNQYGTFTYKQVIDLPNATVRFNTDTGNSANNHKDNTPADYLVVPTNTSTALHGYNLRLSFSPALKSDHSTSGSNYLKDIRNKKLKILGKEYEILKADHTAVNNVKLTLMAGAQRDVLDEGKTKTYNIGGKDYDVTLTFVGTSQAKFTVNGQVTDNLKESDTFKLTDGTELGLVTIQSQNFAGGVRNVDFTLGATKLVLEDTATATLGSGGTVTIGSKDSSSVKVDIVSPTDTGLNDSSSKVTISSINIYYDPSSVLYVGAGESASAVADIVENAPGTFFLSAFDYKYEGLTMDSPETIRLHNGGTTNYKLAFTNKAGVKYDTYLFGLVGGNITFGQSTGSGRGTQHFLVMNESVPIRDEDFLLVSKNKYSRILQFKDIASGTAGDGTGEVRFRDVGTGETIPVTYASLTGNLDMDGNTYRVQVSSDNTFSANSSNVTVDLDGSGTIGDATVGVNSNNGIYTSNEAYVTFPELSGYAAGFLTSAGQASGAPGIGTNATFNRMATEGNSTNVTLMSITSPLDGDNNRDTVSMRMQMTSDGKLDVALVNGTYDGQADSATSDPTGLYQVGDTQKFEGYSYGLTLATGGSTPQYGLHVLHDKKSSTATDQDEVTVWLGKTQTKANVFVTSGAVTKSTSTSSEGQLTYSEPVKINVGAAKFDDEVTVKSQNAIVIGGPCANTAARDLMGVTAENCAEGFSDGKGMIKLYENSGNVAVLVAGFSGTDTRRAARVLADYDKYQTAGSLKGTEVEVAGTSMTQLTVSAPVPKTPVATGNATA
ncbi:S-layer protein [Candidatus Woesearchaeota archaeon]|nr:S-layer protein [Candidatus Woesearchaeota archaeon]